MMTQNMILIADSGSTKTDWTLLDGAPGRRTINVFRSGGCNPMYADTPALTETLRLAMPAGMAPESVGEVHFYGAGVKGPARDRMLAALGTVFPSAELEAESDMLGCARALLRDEAGFAAILGTGMNSCSYDGKNIVSCVPSLGFLLGDEGGAGYIGRLLLRDCLRGTAPEEVRRGVAALLGGMDTAQTVAALYSSPKPNVFCAGLCRYVTDHMADIPYCLDLASGAFDAFFVNVLGLYPELSRIGEIARGSARAEDFADVPAVNFTGSVACVCRELLEKKAAEYGLRCGRILKSPMDGLTEYHRGH